MKKKVKKSSSQQEQKMNLVIVGHVDHGKSTVIGRLLADTHSLPKGKLEQVKRDCERNAKPFEYAFLLDALKDEQAQGITIDSARCFFKTKKREYIIIDAPGHIEFLKNMVSGAARAEAALLVIDAKEGIQENSKRHGYLLSMLGIKQVAVLVNKMDLVGYKQKVFSKIQAEYSKFLDSINIQPKEFIPISAWQGENIASLPKKMKWFRGPHVLKVLDGFDKAPHLTEKPLRMPVQGVYKFTAEGDDRRIIAGRVESGTIRAGEEVIFMPSNKRTRVKTIEAFPKPGGQYAAAGYSAGVTLSEQIYVNRGEVMCKVGQELPLVSSKLQVEIFWMGRKPLVPKKEYKLKIGTTKVPCWLETIKRVIDASSLKKLTANKINRHDVAECVMEFASPIAFDRTDLIETMGRFVIVDDYNIAGGGIITELVTDEQAGIRKQVQDRAMRWDFSIIEPKSRVERYGHHAKLVVLTGQVGVDKKTIAKKLEKKLFERDIKTYFLGIGNLLRGLHADLDRDKPSRREHVRRLGEVAHLFMDAGIIVLATASNLNDEELRLLQEVTDRDSFFVINVGKNQFQEGVVDLNLDEKKTPEKNADRCFKFLESQNIFLTKV